MATTFLAEIKQVSSRKLPSLDIEYKVTLVTNDVTALSLGALSPETVLKVSVEPSDG